MMVVAQVWEKEGRMGRGEVGLTDGGWSGG